MPLAPYTGYVPLSKTSLSCKVEELQIMQSDKRTFGFPLCTIFCAIPLIKDYEVYRSAISERLFNAIKGDVVVLEDIGDVVKGKQINGEFLSESGKYYVMNGGIEPSGFYNDYNVEANTISISEGGNSCGYVQFNACPFWSGGHCYTIQNTTDNVKTEYLYQFLKSKESEIMKLRIGSGLPNIQKKDLAKFKITIPNISEQKVISAFLS